MAENVTILIPTALRPFAGGKEQVAFAGGTVGEVLGQLTGEYADLKRHLYNDSGQLRSFVNVYLNDEDIRYLQKDATPVATGDTVTIVPSIAGGVATMEDVELSPDEIGRYSRHLIMPSALAERTPERHCKTISSAESSSCIRAGTSPSGMKQTSGSLIVPSAHSCGSRTSTMTMCSPVSSRCFNWRGVISHCASRLTSGPGVMPQNSS